VPDRPTRRWVADPSRRRFPPRRVRRALARILRARTRVGEVGAQFPDVYVVERTPRSSSKTDYR
jgi:hypothetical protein